MPLKVLQLLSRLEIGGTERAVIRLASRGIQEGMEHSLLLFDKPFRSETLDFDPGVLATEFIQRGPGIDLQFALKLARKFGELHLDIVHAHNDTAFFYAALAMIIGRFTKAALIGTFRTWPSHDTTGARLLTRWASYRANEITAVSEELNERLLKSGWVRKCTTIWNGVDLTEFSSKGTTAMWRSQLGIPDDAILVGHVGRFDPIKRHSDLFDSAAALQSTRPPIYFALAGNGPLFESFVKRAAQLPSVRLLSNVKDVASFLHGIDIFVICSEHEGAPQALLEAMACARPIIATQVGGIPHILNGGAPPAGRTAYPATASRSAERRNIAAGTGSRTARPSRSVSLQAHPEFLIRARMVSICWSV